MNPFDKISEYLRVKVRKINPNNPKANSGGVILKLYPEFEERVDHLVGIAFHTIQTRFTFATPASPAGTGPLTAISSAIGDRVHRYIQREPVPWNMKVRLGDIFIEAFKECGYVDLYYSKKRDGSYIVSATADWIELADIPEMMARVSLHGTTTTRPLRITSMMQGTEPVIKGKEEGDELDINQPWVRSMDKLQRTGWRINQRVYEALIDNRGLFISDTPEEDNDAKEMKRRSKMVEWAFIMSKGKLLRDEDAFYQILSADYRGRLYYKEAFLNFQGSDFARGMLEFARAKPMTEDGMFWLAVHTASSYNQSYDINDIPEWCEADYKAHLQAEKLDSISVDKFTLEDRVRWTNENMEVIIAAGLQRAIGKEAEKSVSFLACCIEWADIQRAEEEDRIHMSHLPIPIDGSNNGWQHLGAISKDEQTGELVGLIPREIQQDFYVQTAKELLKIDDPKLNAMPMKHVRKAVSKRGSMTRAYSAGAGKIAENMWFDCKAEDFHDLYDIEEKDCKVWAKKLISAINTVCPGPLQTMEYLQGLATYEIGTFKRFKDGVMASDEYSELQKEIKRLWEIKDKPDEVIEEIDTLVKEAQTFETRLVHGNGSDKMTWTTPSGFPVEYVNYRTEPRKCRGTISGKQIKHVAQVPTKSPDIKGFMCGISPNFVHSMDASHMALVIDEWHGEFGAVHDSFSTHACDVESLLAITKAVFIDMYDVDNFYDYIEDQLITDKRYLDVDQPTRGSLKIQEIQDSDYFFA